MKMFLRENSKDTHSSLIKKIIFIGSVILCFLFSIGIYKIVEKRAYIWLPSYIKSELVDRNSLKDIEKPIHIMFCFVDHFEPGWNQIDKNREQKRMKRWMQEYPILASRHTDADGRYPQHTFFYPPHYFSRENLLALGELCYDGFGEIEMHLHHGNDTAESLRKKLEDCKESYAKLGALITAEEKPKKVYGFIHGMWALDNSTGIGSCGVNNELQVLNKTGCYADFTMPAFREAQAKKINSIYYAIDNPDEPKSYNTGIDVRVGGENVGDLMIIQGPLIINWGNWTHKFYPQLENGRITSDFPPTKERVDLWINSNIHVKGRPEWGFVKVYTHGCIDEDMNTLLGEASNKMYSYLEEKYNDGENFKLHYVTAREMYNIIKAAEDGKKGDPNQYRDYLIFPYANTKIKSNVLYELHSYSKNGVKINILEDLSLSRLEFKDFLLKRIEGEIAYLDYLQNLADKEIVLDLDGDGEAKFELSIPEEISDISGGEVLRVHREEDTICYLVGAMLKENENTKIKIKF